MILTDKVYDYWLHCQRDVVNVSTIINLVYNILPTVTYKEESIYELGLSRTGKNRNRVPEIISGTG